VDKGSERGKVDREVTKRRGRERNQKVSKRGWMEMVVRVSGIRHLEMPLAGPEEAGLATCLES
jgi:hypothetical protein